MFFFCLRAPLHHIRPVQTNTVAVCIHALTTSQRAAVPFISASSDAAFFIRSRCISATWKHSDKVPTLCPFCSFFCRNSVAKPDFQRSDVAQLSQQKPPCLSGGDTLKTHQPPNCFQLLGACLLVLEQSPSTTVLIKVLESLGVLAFISTCSISPDGIRRV